MLVRQASRLRPTEQDVRRTRDGTDTLRMIADAKAFASHYRTMIPKIY